MDIRGHGVRCGGVWRGVGGSSATVSLVSSRVLVQKTPPNLKNGFDRMAKKEPSNKNHWFWFENHPFPNWQFGFELRTHTRTRTRTRRSTIAFN